MDGDIDPELQRYADLTVALAADPDDRAARLEAAGFDEASWEAYSDGWQQRLAKSEVVADRQGQVPEMWVQFSLALQRAQERRSKGLIPLEKYAAIARVLARGGDVQKALRENGIALFDFLEAHRHWIKAAASDDALAARLTKLLS